MNQKKNPIKQGKLVRPFSAKEEEEEVKCAEINTLEISGNKVRKGHKLPDKYMVKTQKIDQRQGSPIQKMNTIQSQRPDEFDQINKFETYMQVKMVNPTTKQVYKDISKNNEEFKKTISKPFQTGKIKAQNDLNGSGSKEKQELINNNGSQISDGSTYLSSNKTNTHVQKHQQSQQQQQQQQYNQQIQQPINYTQQYQQQQQDLIVINQRGLSQDLDGFEKQLLDYTAESQSQSDYQVKQEQKPFKLSELSYQNQISQKNLQQKKKTQLTTNNNQIQNIENEEDDFQFIFDNSQWKLIDPISKQNLQKILDERKQNLMLQYKFVQKVKKEKNLDKNFDKMVDQAVIKMQQDDKSDLNESMNKSNIFNYYQFKQEENEDMMKLDMELADQEIKEQQIKWNKLNQMLEESVDSLSQMSREELKNRHLFITDIGRQSGYQQKKDQQQIQKDNSVIEQQQEDDDDDEEEKDYQKQIEKLKKLKRDEKFIERNKVQVFMKYDELIEFQSICDNLPEKGKQRLSELLEDIENFYEESYSKNQLLKQQNPYSVDYNQQQTNINDQKLHQLIFELNEEKIDLEQGILDENVLPKDKGLKEEAEDRILKQKSDYINQELLKFAQSEHSEQTKKADKQKLKGLCEKLKQTVQYVPSNFFLVRKREFEELREQNLQIMEKLEDLEDQSEILETLKEVKLHIQKNMIKVQKGEIEEEKFYVENEKIFEVQNLQSKYRHIQNLFAEVQKDESELLKKYQKWEEEMKLLEEMSKPLKEESENMIIETNSNIDVEEYLKHQQSIDQTEIEQLDREITQKLQKKQPELFSDEFEVNSNLLTLENNNFNEEFDMNNNNNIENIY